MRAQGLRASRRLVFCAILLARAASAAPSDGLPSTLVVPDFAAPGDPSGRRGGRLAEAVRAEAQTFPGLRVLAGEVIAVIAGAHRSELTACAPRCEVPMGRALFATFVLSGELARSGMSEELTLRLYETKGGKLRGMDKASSSDPTELEVAARQLAAALLRSVASPGPATIAQAPVPAAPSSPPPSELRPLPSRERKTAKRSPLARLPAPAAVHRIAPVPALPAALPPLPDPAALTMPAPLADLAALTTPAAPAAAIPAAPEPAVMVAKEPSPPLPPLAEEWHAGPALALQRTDLRGGMPLQGVAVGPGKGRTWSWVAGGGAVVALGAAGIYGLQARSTAAEITGTPHTRAQLDGLQSRLSTQARNANVLFGVGAAMVALSATFFALEF